VQGLHYSYDSVNRVMNAQPPTQTTNNCDLNNWGWYGENNASI
jgi:hypothetical protein